MLLYLIQALVWGGVKYDGVADPGGGGYGAVGLSLGTCDGDEEEGRGAPLFAFIHG